MTLFTCGRKLVAMDFVGPDIDDEEVQQLLQAKRWELLTGFLRRAKGCLCISRRASSGSSSEDNTGIKCDLEASKVNDYDDLSFRKDLSPQLPSLEGSQAVPSSASSTAVQHDM